MVVLRTASQYQGVELIWMRDLILVKSETEERERWQMGVFHHPCECSRWLTNSFQTSHKRHLPLKCLYSMKIEHFLYFGEKGRHGYDIYGYHHHKRWSRSYGNWLLTRFFIVLRWYHLKFCCGRDGRSKCYSYRTRMVQRMTYSLVGSGKNLTWGCWCGGRYWSRGRWRSACGENDTCRGQVSHRCWW